MENGILLFNKNVGVTSRSVDNELGKKFHTHRIGHLGTLDPFASGLLVIAVNKGTKFLPFLMDSPKTYLATLALGVKTSTGDTEGEVVQKEDVPSLNKEMIERVFASFLGDSFQIPPMTSAIKVNGVALYKLAHKGIETERKERPIHIDRLELISISKNQIVFLSTVSTGTYIRVLGEDIAKRLGTVGHLESLKRLSIGNFSLENAVDKDSVSEKSILDPTPFIISMEHYEIDPTLEKAVKDGKKMTLPKDYGEKVLLTLHHTAISVYQKESGVTYASLRGLF